MAQGLPKNLATALAYGAGSQQKIRRSEYLAEALREIQKSGAQPITGGWGELAGRLAGALITKRASSKADAEALGALSSDRAAHAAALLQALKGEASPPDAAAGPPGGPGGPPRAPQPPAIVQAPLAPVQGPGGPPPAAPAAAALAPASSGAAAAQLWPALETRGERSRQDQVSPKGAFGVGQLMPGTAEEMAARAGNPELATLARTDPDVNRQLGQAYLQQQLDAYQLPELALAAYNAGPARVEEWIRRFGDPRKGAVSPQAWAAQIPFKETREYVANVLSGAAPSPAMGAAQPLPMGAPQGASPSQPSPAMSPQVGGGAPAVPPSAPPGGPAAPVAGYWRPSGRQLAYVEQLLSNPRTYEAGVAEAMKLRAKMNEPPEYTVQSINGVPFYVAKTPGQGVGAPQMIPVPQGAMTEVMPAQAAGAASAPAGVYVQRDPLGNVRDVPGAPPQGYQAGPHGRYVPIAGGPADPDRRQAPATGYQWQGAQQAPVSGGPNDPYNPQALFSGTKSFRDEISPVINQAIQLKRNVDSVRQGYEQRNGPGHIAMVNGLQRLIDEGVVREGDVALQLKSQGIQGGISGLRGYMTGDGFFADPAVAEKVMRTADALYGQINATYRDRVMGYKSIAEAAFPNKPGVFETYVLPNQTAQSLGWLDAPAGGQGQGAAAGGAAQFAPSSVDSAIQRAIQMGRPDLLSPRQQSRARELGLLR